MPGRPHDAPLHLPPGPGAPLPGAPAPGSGGVSPGLFETAWAAAATTLFTWLSSRNSRDHIAVFGIKAWGYRLDTKEQADWAWVGYVTRDEVEKACKKLDKVQNLTDDAVEKIRQAGKYKGPADFGTKVHKAIEDRINNAVPKDPNFVAEKSISKAGAEAGYGEKDSVRVDALENRPKHRMVCVYDPKTGWRGLSFTRTGELPLAIRRHFKDALSFFVIEVRPSRK
jgi:hypothetical protein